jgi:Alpha-2,8-polysialyltransferase (POLYST)
MKNITFVVETNYQLMYATILNYFFKSNNYKTKLINYLDKDVVNIKYAQFDFVFQVNKSKTKQNGLVSIIEEFVYLRTNKQDILNSNSELLVVFKDSNYLQGYLIEYFKKKYSSKVILIEEGLSLYRNDRLQEKSIIYIIKYFIRRLIMTLLNAKNTSHGFGYHKLVDMIGAYYPHQLNNIKSKNKEIIQLPHNPPTEEVLSNLNKLYGFTKNTITPEKRVLFIGQPLSEMNICNSEDEKEFFIKINNIAETNNFKIMIKPHPKEDIKKYECFKDFLVINEKVIPAELIINAYQPDIILSWYSSAGINAKTWWGIKTLYLYKLLGIEIRNNGFDGSLIIDSYVKLEEIINELLKEKNNYKNSSQITRYNQYNDLVLNFLK